MSRVLDAIMLAVPQPGEDDPDSTGQGPEWGKAAPIGLLVILLLCVAAVFLFRSFNRQLKKVPASFEADPPAEGLSPSQARVPAVEEPADAAPASDESPPGRSAPGG